MQELIAALNVLREDFNIFPIWRGITGSWGYWEIDTYTPYLTLSDRELIEYTHKLINEL